MSLSHAKRRELHPEPWDGDQPARTLSDTALRVLEYIRTLPDLGYSFSRISASKACRFSESTIGRAEQEIRASIYGGQFRPKMRRKIPREVRARVYQRDDWACRLCGNRTRSELTLGHHPVPYSRGGTDHHTNLRTECRDCNGALGNTEGTTPHVGPEPATIARGEAT